MRTLALVGDVKHVASAGWTDLQVGQQCVGKPIAHRYRRLDFTFELLLKRCFLFQFQVIDHFQRHKLAADDIDLADQVTGDQLALHGLSGYRVRATYVHHERGRCAVCLG